MTPQEVFARLCAMFPELPADQINFLISKLMKRSESNWRRQYPHIGCTAHVRMQSNYSLLVLHGDTISMAVECRESLTVVSLN